ncbi:YopX family protein [Streptococcus pyogenes]
MLTEDTFKKIEELEAACQDTTDNIKKPSHYQGRHGMEAIDVVKNFSACPEHEEGFYWGNAVKYLLRYHAKNGVEIFEGDVVKLQYTITSDLEFFKVNQFRGGSWRIDNRRRGSDLWLRNEDCEVIGNIYQNSDLIESVEE